MNVKIKFSDIAGMLERDQMKEIIGGCGIAGGSGIEPPSGGGSFTGTGFGIVNYNSPLSPVSSLTPAGLTSYTSPSPSTSSINIQTGVSSSSATGSNSGSSSSNNSGSYGGFSTWGSFGASGSSYGGYSGNNGSYGGGSFGTYVGGGLGTGDGVNLYTGAVPPITDHGSITKPTPLEAAFMSKAVYGDYVDPKNLTGWAVSHAADGKGIVFNDPLSGFKSQLFEKTLPNGSKEYCYVTAGTEDWRDALGNVGQLLGISKQYQESTNNAMALATLFGGALSFAGHSLGGGLAEANAIFTGDSALTFNAAGLSPLTAWTSGSDDNTDAYVMLNDPLNEIQYLSNYLPSAGGTITYLDNGGSLIDLTAHSIDTVIKALGGTP